ncbi:MAG: helix-turn-helix domain-containing protein [Akkermansia sp.]|nr:helix-turn-helix domain-containing protein [Akkermansia sp.]
MDIQEINQALKDRGWTQQLLAEKLRMHPVALNRVLTGKTELKPTLAAHIELLLGNTQEQLIMYKITYPDAVVQSWLPGWDELTPEQRKAGIEAVLREATEQLVAEQEARMAPEEVARLKAFCSTLRGPARVFEYKEEKRPFA